MLYEEYEEKKRRCHKIFALKNKNSLAFPIHSKKIYFKLSPALSQLVTFATFSRALGNKKVCFWIILPFEICFWGYKKYSPQISFNLSYTSNSLLWLVKVVADLVLCQDSKLMEERTLTWCTLGICLLALKNPM